MKMRKTISYILLLLLLAMTVETVADNRHRTRSRAVPHAKRKVGNPNILVIDTGMNTRAMELYKGAMENAVAYAHMVNSYKRAWGDNINVYCMVIPTAVALYCPDSLRYKTNDEQATLNSLYRVLDNDVKGIRLLPVLEQRKAEHIYSRTDHHWAPLGAYYAAREFARQAQVDFQPLSAYDKKVVKNFVGTMYKFSGNEAVKNAPEDFVYYTPRDVSYSTLFSEYIFNAKKQVVGEREPVEGSFFRQYADGNGAAYCTFMGGDTKLTKVTTSTANGRKLMILKDSYGNALPGYLFSSFEEIHVVDFRYFRKPIVAYAQEQGITDVLFANNLIHASMKNTTDTYMKKQ